jgi:hypothetical protein
MFKFLKGFLGSDDAPFTINYTEIPEWLSEEKGRIDADLKAAVADSKKTIVAVIERLNRTVDELADAEVTPETHVKLEKIVKTSLPLFTRAMSTSLSKPFPDEPEGFYTAAVEVLKGGLKAMSGQGKYLRATFPEEMKAIRSDLDAFGREINHLTEAFGAARKRRSSLDLIRKACDDVRAARNDQTALLKQYDTAGNEKNEYDRRSGEVADELRRLEEDPAYLVETRRLEELRRLREEQDAVTREYRSFVAVITHVFAKVRKSAIRKGEKPVEQKMHDAIAAMEAFPEAGEEQVIAAVEGALPAVLEKIAGKELELKNKEERHWFSGTISIAGEMKQIFQRYRENSLLIASVEREVTSSPILQKKKAVEAERARLNERQKENEQTFCTSQEQLEKLKIRLPLLKRTLCEKIAQQAKKLVVLDIDGEEFTCGKEAPLK